MPCPLKTCCIKLNLEVPRQSAAELSLRVGFVTTRSIRIKACGFQSQFAVNHSRHRAVEKKVIVINTALWTLKKIKIVGRAGGRRKGVGINNLPQVQIGDYQIVDISSRTCLRRLKDKTIWTSGAKVLRKRSILERKEKSQGNVSK